MNPLFYLFCFPELDILRSAIEGLLDSIPNRFSSFPSATSAFGSVVVAGLAALVSSISHECRAGAYSVRLGVAGTLSFFKVHCQPLVMVLYLPSNPPLRMNPRLTQTQSSTSPGLQPGLRWAPIVPSKGSVLLCSWHRLNS